MTAISSWDRFSFAVQGPYLVPYGTVRTLASAQAGLAWGGGLEEGPHQPSLQHQVARVRYHTRNAMAYSRHVSKFNWEHWQTAGRAFPLAGWAGFPLPLEAAYGQPQARSLQKTTAHMLGGMYLAKVRAAVNLQGRAAEEAAGSRGWQGVDREGGQSRNFIHVRVLVNVRMVRVEAYKGHALGILLH